MCPGLRQGSCHGAYVIRKWWEFGRHRPPLNLQDLEFQKGSKVNLLQALTKEKPERQVGEGPKGQAGAKLVRGYWCGESPRPQGSRSIWGGFSPSNSAQQLALGFRNLAPPDQAWSPGWVVRGKKSRYGDSLSYRKSPSHKAQKAPDTSLQKTRSGNLTANCMS